MFYVDQIRYFIQLTLLIGPQAYTLSTACWGHSLLENSEEKICEKRPIPGMLNTVFTRMQDILLSIFYCWKNGMRLVFECVLHQNEYGKMYQKCSRTCKTYLSAKVLDLYQILRQLSVHTLPLGPSDAVDVIWEPIEYRS